MYLSLAEPDWSELTPGSDYSMGCNKGVWSLDPFRDGLDVFRAKITSSTTCDKFEESSRG